MPKPPSPFTIDPGAFWIGQRTEQAAWAASHQRHAPLADIAANLERMNAALAAVGRDPVLWVCFVEPNPAYATLNNPHGWEPDWR